VATHESFAAVEAIREYAALDNWQVQQIRTAIDEADRGEFASNAEVQRVFRKWMQLSH